MKFNCITISDGLQAVFGSVMTSVCIDSWKTSQSQGPSEGHLEGTNLFVDIVPVSYLYKISTAYLNNMEITLKKLEGCLSQENQLKQKQ